MKKINLKNQNIYPHFLALHSLYHKKIREWMGNNQYQEFWCPPLSPSPCFETHVHPFQIYSPKNKKHLDLYLQTSPEFVLKNYLLNKVDNKGIYNLNFVFRDDESSPIHRQQFIMLEFYRLLEPVSGLVLDLKNLLTSIVQFLATQNIEHLPVEKITSISVNELFLQYLKFPILDFLTPKDLYQKIAKDFPEIKPHEILAWDDLFNLLWLNFIEKNLKNYQALLITDYPSPISLLAQTNEKDPRSSHRFELFVHGNEIANGYFESANFEENTGNIEQHLKMKKQEYNYQLNSPQFFLNELKNKKLPVCYGVAMGTERLLQTLVEAKSAFIDYSN